MTPRLPLSAGQLDIRFDEKLSGGTSAYNTAGCCASVTSGRSAREQGRLPLLYGMREYQVWRSDQG